MASFPMAVWIVSLILVLYVLFRRFARPSLSMIRGPKSPSFIYGHLLELFQRPVGEAEFKWQNLYGNVVRIRGVLGEERLLIADPKALHRMFNTSGYTYAKLPNLRTIGEMVIGKGIMWADGEIHKRHRSVLAPGFGSKECKEFLPIFIECANSLSLAWSNIINGNSQPVTVDVLAWFNRGALDVIGQAAFDVQFGTIQDDAHVLAKKYKNIMADLFGMASAQQTFIQSAVIYVPMWILRWITDHGSHPRLVRARSVKRTVTGFARELVREKANALLQENSSRDIFTLLVKANMDAGAKNKLSEEELLSQMCTILMGGHETTANSLSWIFFELARNPGVQSRLRNEIHKTEAGIHARGDIQFTATDLADMPYLNAVVKEGLRFHPVGPHVQRMARQDDILPLSKPIHTEAGDVINQVLVPKGTQILVSVSMYNRDKDIWGEDAHDFNPDRWLNGTIDETKSAGVGAYSHMMTFLSGARSCLGWRLATIEIQTFLFKLVGKFEFGMTDKEERIIRLPVLVMAPAVDGELEKGTQLPLAVTFAPLDGA